MCQWNVTVPNQLNAVIGVATAVASFSRHLERAAIASDRTINRKERRKKLAELRRKKGR